MAEEAKPKKPKKTRRRKNRVAPEDGLVESKVAESSDEAQLVQPEITLERPEPMQQHRELHEGDERQQTFKEMPLINLPPEISEMASHTAIALGQAATRVDVASPIAKVAQPVWLAFSLIKGAWDLGLTAYQEFKKPGPPLRRLAKLGAAAGYLAASVIGGTFAILGHPIAMPIAAVGWGISKEIQYRAYQKDKQQNFQRISELYRQQKTVIDDFFQAKKAEYDSKKRGFEKGEYDSKMNTLQEACDEQLHKLHSVVNTLEADLKVFERTRAAERAVDIGIVIGYGLLMVPGPGTIASAAVVAASAGGGVVVAGGRQRYAKNVMQEYHLEVDEAKLPKKSLWQQFKEQFSQKPAQQLLHAHAPVGDAAKTQYVLTRSHHKTRLGRKVHAQAQAKKMLKAAGEDGQVVVDSIERATDQTLSKLSSEKQMLLKLKHIKRDMEWSKHFVEQVHSQGKTNKIKGLDELHQKYERQLSKLERHADHLEMFPKAKVDTAKREKFVEELKQQREKLEEMKQQHPGMRGG